MKVLPHDIEAERAILSYILQHEEGMEHAMEILKGPGASRVFYDPFHQEVYASAVALYQQQKQISILTVKHQNRNLDAPRLSEITNAVARPHLFDDHIKILTDQYMRRELIRISGLGENFGYRDNHDPHEAVIDISNQFSAVSDPFIRSNLVSMQQGVPDVIKEMEVKGAEMKEKGGTAGVPTGFAALDEITSGSQAPEMTIWAARPGMGKTATALTAIYRSAKMGYPQLLFSLEMTADALIKRLISIHTEVENHKLKTLSLQKTDWDRISSAYEELMQLPIYIEHVPGINVHELRSKSRKYVRKHGISRIWIDYIQLITPDREAGRSRNDEVGTISRGITQQIAGELRMPVEALSQLSRDVDKRHDPYPRLSDLRDSGSLEQDAANVIFLYRPGYYKNTHPTLLNSRHGDIPPHISERITWLILAKQRNGAVVDLPFDFHNQTTEMRECSPETLSRLGLFHGSMPDDYQNYSEPGF